MVRATGMFGVRLGFLAVALAAAVAVSGGAGMAPVFPALAQDRGGGGGGVGEPNVRQEETGAEGLVRVAREVEAAQRSYVRELARTVSGPRTITATYSGDATYYRSVAVVAFPGGHPRVLGFFQDPESERALPGPTATREERERLLRGEVPLGLAVQGLVDGSRPVRVLRAFVRLHDAQGRVLRLVLKGQNGRVVWEGPSRHPYPVESPGPALRPNYIPRVVCIETVDLEGEWPGFVPASEEGTLPTTVVCVDLGWVQATGSARGALVGSWQVPASAWSDPAVFAVRVPDTVRRAASGLRPRVEPWSEPFRGLLSAVETVDRPDAGLQVATAFTYVEGRAGERLGALTATAVWSSRGPLGKVWVVLTSGHGRPPVAAYRFLRDASGVWSDTATAVALEDTATGGQEAAQRPRTPSGIVIVRNIRRPRVQDDPGDQGSRWWVDGQAPGRRGVPYVGVDPAGTYVGMPWGDRLVIKCSSRGKCRYYPDDWPPGLEW